MECALTTYDNPYNPFDDFDNWFLFDVTKGYNTCALVARFFVDDDSLSDEERNFLNEKAIDKVLNLDFECIYKKVYRSDNSEKLQ